MNERDGFFYSAISEKRLYLSEGEVATRLMTDRSFSCELVDRCERTLRTELDCKYAAARVPIFFPAEGKVDLGSFDMESHDLYKNLKGCSEAFIFAVTIGHGADRLIKRLAYTSAAEHFITDALASAFAEAAADFAETEIKGSLSCRVRFSPGYGDLPLTVQPQVLETVNAGRLLGITLGKSLLMSPSKSITAIMGIKDRQ